MQIVDEFRNLTNIYPNFILTFSTLYYLRLLNDFIYIPRAVNFLIQSEYCTIHTHILLLVNMTFLYKPFAVCIWRNALYMFNAKQIFCICINVKNHG